MRLRFPRFVGSGAVLLSLLLQLCPCLDAAAQTDPQKEQKESLEEVSKVIKKLKSKPKAHYVSLGKVLFLGLRTGVKLKSGDDWAKGAASAFDGISSVHALDYGECSDADRESIEAAFSVFLIRSNLVLEEKGSLDTIEAYGALLPDGKTVSDVIIVMKDQAVFCLKGKILRTDIKRTAGRLRRQL